MDWRENMPPPRNSGGYPVTGGFGPERGGSYESRSAGDEIPWEIRREVGRFQAAVSTFVGSPVTPWKLFAPLASGRGGSALSYALILGSAIITIRCLVSLDQMYAQGAGADAWVRSNFPSLRRVSDESLGKTLSLMFQGADVVRVFIVIIGVTFVPIYLAFRLYFSAAVQYLIQISFGVRDGGFKGTMAATCYILPVWLVMDAISVVLGMIWGSVIYICARKHAHQVTYLRATLAVWIPGLVVLVLLAAGIQKGWIDPSSL